MLHQGGVARARRCSCQWRCTIIVLPVRMLALPMQLNFVVMVTAADVG
jgi:hypothetical protein